jgi:hypothetical protein
MPCRAGPSPAGALHEVSAFLHASSSSVFIWRNGTGINFLTGVALFGGSYLFSLFCGTVMQYTALDTGRVF